MAHEADSPVLKQEEQEHIPHAKYSVKEEKYLRNLQKKMENSRDARDRSHEEFDGMSYVGQYDLFERLANTYIAPKINKEDTNFQSGTIRTKLFAILSSLVNLNLSGDISSFDKEGLKIQALGDAMEDVILKTNELDGDDEKKNLRQYEMLKHGTVFVEEIWDKKKKKSKKTTKEFNGKIKEAEWTTKLEDAFSRPVRNIIPGINVYLGDLTKYDISDQPFIYTVESIPYVEAEAIFGEWDRWDNVPKKIVQAEATSASITLYNPNWRLLDTDENFVEVIRYQDKWNNEFAVMLNGVLMTPIGLPLPWGYDEYNVVQQNLEPIHAKFAYGKSLVSRIRNKTALLDEMMRLAVLKTQKSFMPPYINISGRVLSNRVLMPGKITYGIQPNTLMPINEKEAEGVTQAEFAMIKELQESIDGETTSPTFQGQKTQGQTTATEIIELQRQAKQMMGLIVFAASMLEWKLEWKRLNNNLVNWFNPDDTVVDEVRGVIKDKYRQVSVERNIEGEGMGRRIVVPTEDIPSSDAIRKAEDALTKEQNQPVRLIFLNPKEVQSSNLVWQIVVKPKEKKTSETAKLLWRAFMQDVLILDPNIEYLQERTANVWEEDAKKLFAPNPQPTPEQQAQAQGEGGTLSPRVSLPSPEKAASKGLQSSLTTANA